MIKTIKANARLSVKQPPQRGDVFYTFEYGEEREDDFSNTLEEQRKKLWDDVNNEINKQIIEVKNLYKSS